jgi:hypothetical protein
MLGPNPTQEHFRLAAYYLIDLAFQASRAEMLTWGEFMERYTAMYPRGQPGFLDNPMTAYVNNLRVTDTTSGTATTRRAPTTHPRDPMRECDKCVASVLSSFDSELAPRHRATNTQQRARLDKLAEARRQLDEELAILHRELGQDPEPRDRQPAPLPVQ